MLIENIKPLCVRPGQKIVHKFALFVYTTYQQLEMMNNVIHNYYRVIVQFSLTRIRFKF